MCSVQQSYSVLFRFILLFISDFFRLACCSVLQHSLHVKNMHKQQCCFLWWTSGDICKSSNNLRYHITTDQNWLLLGKWQQPHMLISNYQLRRSLE